MIKRFVKNGKVINSTTETIAPKPTASESKTTLVQLDEEDEEIVSTRTCNSCIQGKLDGNPERLRLLTPGSRIARGEICHLHNL